MLRPVNLSIIHLSMCCYYRADEGSAESAFRSGMPDGQHLPPLKVSNRTRNSSRQLAGEAVDEIEGETDAMQPFGQMLAPLST